MKYDTVDVNAIKEKWSLVTFAKSLMKLSIYW